MERKIFLEENRSRFSVNKPNKMGVDLDTNVKLTSNDGIDGNFSLFEQYNADRDACNRFRMIFSVNPICSNVLFNMHTEIVKDEGSDNPIVIDSAEKNLRSLIPNNTIVNTTGVNRYQAIKDTEYSHPSNGGFEYHCGVDIFNNHMLRNNGFCHVNKIAEGDTRSARVYNTIEDFLRDGSGKIVENNVNPNSTNPNEKQLMHLYSMDSILSFKKAYLEKIKERDGWIGFVNPGNIDVPNSDKKDGEGNDVLLNQMLANRKPCEFIDMYPDRSLYSFIPKYNEYRDRAEKNWDYCITYPYEKDENLLNTVFGGKCGAIKVEFEEGTNSSSVDILMCRPLLKHTLSTGSKISIYYYDGDTFKKYPIPVRVIGTGNYDGSDTDRFFSIRVSDLGNSFQKFNGTFYYRKISNGCECEYYFRKYKKITKDDGSELRNDLGKLAYAENIYGDRIAQVVFTDDIDVSKLYDHNGRPVSEVYFTVVKRNAGREQWSEGNYGSEKVEFSHCFGEVTSGLDFGPFSGAQQDYNVRCLTNVNTGRMIMMTDAMSDVFGEAIQENTIPSVVEHNITIDNDIFYGDIVEFDPYLFEEHELSPVLHRFNTVQREFCEATDFYPLYYDKVVSDDYDLDSVGIIKTLSVARTNISKSTYLGSEISIPSNIRPEGYFYNPHTKIKVKEDSGVVNRIRTKSVNYGSVFVAINNGLTIVRIKAPTSYEFTKWDRIAFVDEGGLVNGEEYANKTIWGTISEVSGLNLTIEFEGRPFGGPAEQVQELLIGENRRFRAYFCKESIPIFAKFNKGTQEFVWRGFDAPSVMTRDMELYDTPFANGRFYIEKNINFYLRRQDPFGEFGLSYAKHTDDNVHASNPSEYFNLDSEYLDLSQIFNFYNKIDNICY